MGYSLLPVWIGQKCEGRHWFIGKGSVSDKILADSALIYFSLKQLNFQQIG